MPIAKLFALHTNEINNFHVLNSTSYIFSGYMSFDILQKHRTYKQSTEKKMMLITQALNAVLKNFPLRHVSQTLASHSKSRKVFVALLNRQLYFIFILGFNFQAVAWEHAADNFCPLKLGRLSRLIRNIKWLLEGSLIRKSLQDLVIISNCNAMTSLNSFWLK